MDELNRACIGLNQRPQPSPQNEHAPISPERFVIGSPAGMQPKQTGGTLPSAAPPAGVLKQQIADFGAPPADMQSNQHASGAGAEPSFQGSPMKGNPPHFGVQAGGDVASQQIPTERPAQHNLASQHHYLYFDGGMG